MIHLAHFLKIDRTSATSVYRQIADGIIALIERKILYTGVRLQSTRELSEALKVHRKTAVMAYTELAEQGWIKANGRRGFSIAMTLPTATPVVLKNQHSVGYAPLPVFKMHHRHEPWLVRNTTGPSLRLRFNDGFPDVRLAPLDALLAEYHSLAKRKLSRPLLGYSAKEGSLKLREALAKELRQTRGMPVTPDNIMVSRGAQNGISLIASFLIKPGDTVVVAKPNYFLANLLFERLGAKLLYIPVDDSGMDVDRLERLCRKRKVRMVYVIPHHHHPTTVTLSPERRLKLLSLAERHKFAILEDDFDFDLHYANKPVLPMASIDRSGSVIYVGTLSKVMAPAIRIGYVVGSQKFIELLTQHKFLMDMQGDTLMEEAIAGLFLNGTIDRHLKKVRRIYKERRDTVVDFLRSELSRYVTFREPEGGMSIWTTFVRTAPEPVSKIAAQKGLFLCDGKKHNVDGENYNSILLGFASLNTSELHAALEILKHATKTAS